MDCKHDWRFVSEETLRCTRCSAETGPRTAEQRAQDMMQDIATIGSAWSRGGERIEPTTVYKLALEALEAFLRFAAIHHDGPDTSDKYLAEDYAVEGFRKARQVLPALRTAIETAEKQEPPVQFKCTVVDDQHPAGVPLEQWGTAAQQEPVGEVSGHDWSTGLLYRDLEPGTPLYTAPPKRPWVGLTDEEAMQTWGLVIKYAPGEVRLKDFARLIQDKLKEKNNG
jgi:hypothetical protein